MFSLNTTCMLTSLTLAIGPSNLASFSCCWRTELTWDTPTERLQCLLATISLRQAVRLVHVINYDVYLHVQSQCIDSARSRSFAVTTRSVLPGDGGATMMMTAGMDLMRDTVVSSSASHSCSSSSRPSSSNGGDGDNTTCSITNTTG